MRRDGDETIFSTGKRVYAHCGIIGLDSDLNTYEGYDGGFEDNKLTSEEKLELANYMIAAWNEYKLKISSMKGI